MRRINTQLLAVKDFDRKKQIDLINLLFFVVFSMYKSYKLNYGSQYKVGKEKSPNGVNYRADTFSFASN